MASHRLGRNFNTEGDIPYIPDVWGHYDYDLSLDQDWESTQTFHQNDENDLSYELMRHTRRQRPTTAILSDSILRYADLGYYADLYPVPGATTLKLIWKLQEGVIKDWMSYRLLIVHVGTNDIDNGDTTQVLRRFKSLTRLVVGFNPYIKIIFSSILPRARDFKETQSLVDTVNYGIRYWCKRTPGMGFYPGYKNFVKSFRIRPDRLHMYKRDGLHLNRASITYLEILLRKLVVYFNRGHLGILKDELKLHEVVLV